MPEKQEHFFANTNEEIKPATPESKPAELEGLHERISLIIRTISGKLNLEVTTDVDLPTLLAYAKKGEDARKVWFRRIVLDPKTKKFVRELVHIPKRILESNENIAKGKAAHEAGHVLITRQADFVPDEVLQQLGFHALLQAVEERPTDQVVRERYSGAGLWVDESRKEGNKRYRAMTQKQKEALGYIPKFMQFANLCVYAPHYEELPPYSTDVLAAYEKVKERVEEVERTLPLEDAGEKEITKSAKERYSITYLKIWPEMEKLVKKDLELEKLRQMLERAASGEGGEKSEKEGGQKPSQGQKEAGENRSNPVKLQELLKQLPEELKRELEKMRSSQTEEGEGPSEKEKARPDAKKGQGGVNKDEVGEDEAGEDETGEDDAGEGGTEEKEASEGEEAEGQETEGPGNGKKEEGTKNIEGKKSGKLAKGEKEKTGIFGQEEGEKQEGNPFPMDKMSDELKKELEKIFDSLSEEEKEFLEHLAQKVMEHIEDEIVREFSEKLSKEEPETHGLYEVRKEKEVKIKKRKALEERVKQEKEKAKYELAEIEKKQAKISANKDEYMRAYEEVRGLDEALYRKLEEIFTPNIKRNIKLKSAGLKPNLLKVFKWEAGKQGGAKVLDSKIFELYSRYEKKDYAFSLLNDMSTSMEEHGKIEHDFKAKVLLAEVLNRLGVKFSVQGFNTGFFRFKDFGEDLRDTVRKKMNDIMKMVGGWTDTGRALITISRDLEKEFAKEKFLLVLTDGIPQMMGKDAASETHRAVADILKKTGQKLIGIGLGPKTEFVRNFFPASIVEEDVSKLSETLAVLLEDMILNPEKYAYKDENA